jgi:hypothetical protein
VGADEDGATALEFIVALAILFNILNEDEGDGGGADSG